MAAWTLSGVAAGVRSFMPAAVLSAAEVCPLSAAGAAADRRSPPHPRKMVRQTRETVLEKPPFIANDPFPLIAAAGATVWWVKDRHDRWNAR
jgi:hypothetical protein